MAGCSVSAMVPVVSFMRGVAVVWASGSIAGMPSCCAVGNVASAWLRAFCADLRLRWVLVLLSACSSSRSSVLNFATGQPFASGHQPHSGPGRYGYVRVCW